MWCYSYLDKMIPALQNYTLLSLLSYRPLRLQKDVKLFMAVSATVILKLLFFANVKEE